MHEGPQISFETNLRSTDIMIIDNRDIYCLFAVSSKTHLIYVFIHACY